ncbi:hypothetical protein AAFN60_01230 [Roseibacillus persicicus]|uniref:hypothetical protein n=1 Tax=Roseibacillus persicicus TaxID=454148 RepID=UPI00398AEFC5
MEQPPLIDVDPEDEPKSKLAGCTGCVTRILPIMTGLLLALVVLLGVVFFIWGSDRKDEELVDEGAPGEGTESVEPKKKTFLEKVKSVVKGESKKPPVEEAVAANEEASEAGPGGAGAGAVEGAVEKSVALAESVGAEGKSPEERNKLLKEKFGHLEENRPESGTEDDEGLAAVLDESGNLAAGAGGADALVDPSKLGGDSESGELPAFPQGADEMVAEATRRGGSYGSSTGAASQEENKSYMIWRSDLSTAGSDLECEIIFQETGGQLHFRLFLLPYDSSTSKLFRAGKGDFLVSFIDSEGKRLVPTDENFKLPLNKMTAFESAGMVSGWVTRGIIPLNEVQPESIHSVRLGWDLDPDLSDWLKELKLTRGQ